MSRSLSAPPVNQTICVFSGPNGTLLIHTALQQLQKSSSLGVPTVGLKEYQRFGKLTNRKSPAKPSPLPPSKHIKMCYIDLQHYIHCKHTNAKFRSCRDPISNRTTLESGDHNVFRAELHSYDRLCGECYINAIDRAIDIAIDRAAQLPEDWHRGDIRTRLEFQSTKEIIDANREAGKEVPFGVNEDHDGKTIACMFEGGIDRESALRQPRQAFHNIPTHVANTVPPGTHGPAFISAGQAYDVDFIHDECDPTTNVKEILMYFSACGHFNGVWCEELMEKDGGFVTERCGCDRYDEKLATKQYAESAELCLRCRVTRGPDNWRLLSDMVRDVSGDRELALWPCSQRRPYREVR
ncbi:hypothetical protein H2200_011606 [Cladophialophora chaetospira]|uniref:Uncharacterized protein n=1 Tax=Cladophialophora chaetospira TaxID=386627 RepID=A0AA38WZP0_9EURO|nr:hypothetical protein H2200_011606 [Cladophialophora chaetospira]